MTEIETRVETFADRARALLEEGREEARALEERRQALIAEREDAIARVRETYAVRLAEVQEELSTLKRLERALEPDRAKAKAKPSKTITGPPSRNGWVPSQRYLDAIVRVLDASGGGTITSITDQVDASRGTVETAMGALRNDGLVRLAGEVKASDDPSVHTRASLYKLTRTGKGRATELAQNGEGDDGEPHA